MKNNWFVITGGPCSGKSTTLQLLSKKGFKVTQETAREYIDSEIKKGVSLLEIRSNPQKLQDNIAKAQIKLEESLNPNEAIFLDRAVPDSIGYYNFLKIKCPDFVSRKAKGSEYKTVFFLEQLPYVNDSVRDETKEQAEEISRALEKAYSNLNIEFTKVPVMDKKKRVEFILKKALLV